MLSRRLLTDSYYDLYAGRYVLAHGIPRVNVVTVTARGAPWIDQQWLAQAAFYAAWAAGGYRALALASAALVTAGYAIWAALMARRGVPPARAFAWTAVAFSLSLGSTGIRAQSFGFLFFPAALWLATEADGTRPPRARDWLLVPVLVLWANAHGSVLSGAGVAALCGAVRAARLLARRRPGAGLAHAALGAASAGSVLCTPYGAGVLGYYRSLIADPVLARYVAEWARPSATGPLGVALYALAAADLLAVVLAWRRRARPDPLLCCAAAALLGLALASFRGVPWFGFGGSLLAADTLARAGAGQRAPDLAGAFRAGVAGALAGTATLAAGMVAAQPAGAFMAGEPLRAIAVAAGLADREPGRLVLADWSAAPMLWLHPAMFGRVGFDPRLEQYAPAQVAAFASFLLDRGAWQRVTRGYDIIVLSRPAYPQLARALAGSPGWRVAYRDRNGVVFARRGT